MSLASGYSHPCVVLAHIIPGLVCVTMEYGKGNAISLVGLSHKRFCGFCLPLCIIGLKEASRHLVRTLTEP